MYSSAFVSQRYIIYYNSRNLHGFRDYIELNKKFSKTLAKNEFKKNLLFYLYKLMNNAAKSWRMCVIMSTCEALGNMM